VYVLQFGYGAGGSKAANIYKMNAPREAQFLAPWNPNIMIPGDPDLLYGGL